MVLLRQGLLVAGCAPECDLVVGEEHEVTLTLTLALAPG